ncbi:MAG: nitroreductase family protein [Desulfobulbus sp.]|jgi:ferredoxin|uniref:nitroreductase family protein n=1 Tax=Desulfobulbus sp. TaxID=895 RepID=UPI00283FD8B0|nr:nitroreductase family protein [Desulfobulbus sp.]MDR2551093.1 nitroreductase family protein [Desulfobulbus sp.]
MDLHFTVDRELCIQCGACIDDCPFHIIEMIPEYPALNPKREHHCIRCQHCLAVCPTGALSILGRRPEDSLPLPQTLPTSAQMTALIKGRRSVRRFLPEPLAPEVIDTMIATVANAPTGKNNRKCLFTVIDDPASMEVLRRETIEGLRRAAAARRLGENLSYFRHVVSAWDQGRDIVFRHAPHLLMVSVPPEVTTPDADAIIAMSYFELLAASMGIGTLWNAMIRWAFATIDVDLYQRLGIPDDHTKGYALLFGRPAVQYHRTVQRDGATINRVRLT